VTITGNVPTTEEKMRIGEMARAVPGVRDVVNSIEVRPTN
jgi:osmotically-inducible protein OsmY